MKNHLITFLFLLFIFINCSSTEKRVDIGLLFPCISESKNFKAPTNIEKLRFLVVQKDNRVNKVIQDVSIVYESGKRIELKVKDGENIKIVVEGYDIDGNVIAGGQTDYLNLNENSSVSIIISTVDSFFQTTNVPNQDCTEMPQGLEGATITPLPDGNVLIAGGVGRDGSSRFYSSSLYLYNFNSGTYEEIKAGDDIKEFGTRAYHTATLYNKGTDEKPEWKVLLAGGLTYINGREESIISAEIYDVKSKTVKLLSENMKSARAYHTATLMQNGVVAIIGGERRVEGKIEDYYDTVELFDIHEEKFYTINAKMAYGRSRHTATYLPLRYNVTDGTLVPGFDKILVAGGIRETNNSLYINDSMEIFGCTNVSCTDYRFDIVRKRDSTTLNMMWRRYGHQAVPVMIGAEPIIDSDDEFHNFYVLFIGGYTCIGIERCAGTIFSADCNCPNNNVFGSITKNIEIFEYTNSQGSQIRYNTEMQIPRADFGAVYIPRDTNNLLIFGGYTPSGSVTDLVETMTVLNNKVTMPTLFSSKLLFPRADFAYGILYNGLIMIAGGNNGKSSISSVEMFNPYLKVNY
jgi:hypothetical protein